MPDLAVLTDAQLLGLYTGVLDELRRREVVRSTNNPVGDYCELLCCAAFGWTRAPKSTGGHDAVDAAGARYQVKGRRLTAHNDSTVLGDIADLETTPFHVLAGVLLNEDFTVRRAALIPHAVVLEHAAPRRSGKRRLDLRNRVWTLAGVQDVTADLRAVQR